VSTDSEPTTTGTEPRLFVFHLLRLGGFVTADRLAARSGLPESDVTAILEQERAAGLALERNGRISGWMLTADGRSEHAALLADELERLGAREAIEEANIAFLALNEPFKELCSRWQLRPDGSTNDHTDLAYDTVVIEDLTPLHDRVVALTSTAAQSLPRFGRYPQAFSAARDRLMRGDQRAFAAPLAESFHDAWMELHQDLLSTLGRRRSTADGH
jgi:hypothetical protein